MPRVEGGWWGEGLAQEAPFTLQAMHGLKGQRLTRYSLWLTTSTHHPFAKVLARASQSASFQGDHSFGAVITFLLIEFNSIF